MQLSNFFQPSHRTVQSVAFPSPAMLNLIYRGVSYQRCHSRSVKVAEAVSDRGSKQLVYRGATYAITTIPNPLPTPISYLERQLLLYRGSTYAIGGTGF